MIKDALRVIRNALLLAAAAFAGAFLTLTAMARSVL